MNTYPKIYFACRTRQYTDERLGVKLTASQLSILDCLDWHFPTNLQDLAMQIGVTPSTMTEAIDRLVLKGLVARQKNVTDGRKTNLVLTLEGDAIKRSKTLLDRKLVEELLGGMPEDTRERALEGLQALADAAAGMQRSRSTMKPWNRDIFE